MVRMNGSGEASWPAKIAGEALAAQERTSDALTKARGPLLRSRAKQEVYAMVEAANRRWCLAKYPEGIPALDTWRLETQEVPQPGPRQILVKAKWLSVDPYMRGRMSPAQGYTKGAGIGEVMPGGGVGEVVASNHPDWKPGDIADSMAFGWQEYAVLTPDVAGTSGVNRADPAIAPIQSALSWLGMPGMTAYFGLLELGRPKPGDTVLVSAASGAVGQLVGQIAKLCGARAVAVAGSDDKLAWCREIGFDETINYKTAIDLTAAVKAACPDGVNVFFDNTGGPIQDAALKNLAIGARVIICGRIAQVDRFGKPEIGERLLGSLIVSRASIHGLLVFDWWHRRDEAVKRLAAWGRAGKLRYAEDVLDGIERMPEAFLRLLSGANFGKQLVRLP
jgi:NADPH-dependent curcumin reductase CurA